ncbi:MAG: response regulator [Gammaproteobacteria bacterium]|nr:response regulator [Gammaproteobacteria bacterium]MCP5197820.1 response regulator [Gammaproteobacteria bacterium]
MSHVTHSKFSRILIVDDEKRNINLIETLLQAEGYATLAAISGSDALTAATAEAPDLILLDIMMPGLDGFETVARLKANPHTQSIPVIMVTTLDDRSSKLRALNAGAEEFLTKPIDRADLSIRVRNLLRLKEYNDFLVDHNRILEQQVGERTTQLETAYRDTMLMLSRAAEYKDEETGLHVRRISYYSHELATAMGMPSDFCKTIYHSSPMHDVGKIGIPDCILLKPGSLSVDEWKIMKTHCVLGSNILTNGTSPYTHMGAEIALSHHERWDGSGYPNGLKGEMIPLSARIMQICDVYDALRSRRPYKPALSHPSSVAIIMQGDTRTKPEHFDPAVLAAFSACADDLATIYKQHTDDEYG